MYVLHHHLKAVKTASFRNLNLSAKSLGKVFQDDTITGCEESKHMLDEVLLIFVEFWPVS